jgi:hypothetical protein
LSRNVLRSLVKRGGYNFEVPSGLKEFKFEKVASYFNRSSSNQSEIPPAPTDETPSHSTSIKKRTAELTDVEIEEAIAPLFNYLNDSFAVLWECLSGEGKLAQLTTWSIYFRVG